MSDTRPILFLGRRSPQLRWFRSFIANTGIAGDVRRAAYAAQLPALGTVPPVEIESALKVGLLRTTRKYGGGGSGLLHALYRAWARLHIRRYLRLLRSGRYRALGVWNGWRMPESMAVAAARALDIPVLFFDDGPLPRTRMVDLRGINYANSLPRDPAFYAALPAPAAEPERALVARKSSRPGTVAPVELPPRFLFAPFQVNRDSQVILYSPWIADMNALFGVMQRLREKLAADPATRDLAIVLREHPSCRDRYPHLHEEARRLGMLFANGNPMPELLEKAEGVLTINSTVGIEALLLGKKAVVLGQAFYDLPGLTLSAPDEAALLEAVRRLPRWQPDSGLRARFLDYLARQYCIPLKDGAEDWPAVGARVRALLG